MIGVIVPARDEAQRIRRCVASIRAAERAAGEPVFIVVVADACRDDTALLAHPMADLVLTTSAGCVGIARRIGCDAALDAGCRWLAHTDADGEVPVDWLAAQLRSASALFCGTVTLGASRWLSDNARRLYDARYRPEDGHRHVHGANLGIDAKAYRQLGGFADLRSHEDVDLVRRAEQAGLSIAWSAQVPVRTSARLNARAPEGFAAYLARLTEECNANLEGRGADPLREAAVT